VDIDKSKTESSRKGRKLIVALQADAIETMSTIGVKPAPSLALPNKGPQERVTGTASRVANASGDLPLIVHARRLKMLERNLS
jgi:hypothetical protein